MPAPITHIVLAFSFLNNFPHRFNEREFIIGSCHPDIRYLGVAKRSETHMKNPTWEQVFKEKSSFQAGVFFHSLVDKLYDNFLEKQNHVLSALPLSARGYVVKFIQDSVLIEKNAAWPAIAHHFDEILPQEIDTGYAREKFDQWHKIIKTLIGTQPLPGHEKEFVDRLVECGFSEKLQESSAITVPCQTTQKTAQVFAQAIVQLLERAQQIPALKKMALDFYAFMMEEIAKQVSKKTKL